MRVILQKTTEILVLAHFFFQIVRDRPPRKHLYSIMCKLNDNVLFFEFKFTL